MGNWTEWNGGPRPVGGDTMVEVRLRNGDMGGPYSAGTYYWAHGGFAGDVVAYRVAWRQPIPPCVDHAYANDNHPQEDVFMAGKPKNPPWELTAAEFDELRAAQPWELTADVKAAIADEAKRIVTGARRAAYGKPEDNFARIAAYWNAYAQCKGWSVVFAAADVSPMMRGMKEARLCETPDHRDSFVDLVGYTLTGAEINGVAA